MSSPLARLNLTPQGLFPEKVNADQDPKCRVIAKVIAELFEHSSVFQKFTQVQVQENAQKRYEYLSKPKISEAQIDRPAHLLFQNGVSQETIKEYFSFRFPREEATLK